MSRVLAARSPGSQETQQRIFPTRQLILRRQEAICYPPPVLQGHGPHRLKSPFLGHLLLGKLGHPFGSYVNSCVLHSAWGVPCAWTVRHPDLHVPLSITPSHVTS